MLIGPAYVSKNSFERQNDFEVSPASRIGGYQPDFILTTKDRRTIVLGRVQEISCGGKKKPRERRGFKSTQS
jgi:hypothetical protein